MTLLQILSFNLLVTSSLNFFIFSKIYCGPSRVRTYDFYFVRVALWTIWVMDPLCYKSIIPWIWFLKKSLWYFLIFCWATRIRTQNKRTRIFYVTPLHHSSILLGIRDSNPLIWVPKTHVLYQLHQSPKIFLLCIYNLLLYCGGRRTRTSEAFARVYEARLIPTSCIPQYL